eukprot:TRINITY_DN108375_c0_g1_i1.p1 TRINITY_DN108375_c0_g1~~TRINITY_DN108375_c0_g1_i1.p1  ORF type:complete len:297 (-),score=66.83 TRINITY_DN108375_c0_g1_i1:119-1009(-)
MVDSGQYYEQFHGHDVELLEDVLAALKAGHRRRSVIFFAGDSSLDNKYWLEDDEWFTAVNGYENILQPRSMKPDVCYWTNWELMKRGLSQICALNTAVEATTVHQRQPGWLWGGLTEQDEMIRDTITKDDYLIVSVGGNDIALAPTAASIFNMLAMMKFASDESLEDGTAFGLSHFVSLFRDQVQEYVKELVSKQKPRRILICTIYYPDEGGMGSWADTALSALDYNENPHRLQLAISYLFSEATSKIEVDGVQVVPIPLFSVMTGKDTHDYIERVEPSSAGGHKMAKLLVERLIS